MENLVCVCSNTFLTRSVLQHLFHSFIVMRGVYHDRRVTGSDLKESLRIRKAIRERCSDRARTARRYITFCQLNRCTPFEGSSHIDFLASVRVQLSAASAAKHAAHLRILLYETKQNPVQLSLGAIIKLFNEEHAQKKVRSSPDFKTWQDALRAARGIRNATTRCACMTMLLCGPRLADLSHITFGDNLFIDPAMRIITLDITFSKNRRKTAERFRIKLGPTELMDVPRTAWQEWCATWARVGRVAIDWDVAAAALREACATLRITSTDDRDLTPGSLRRQFVHARIREWTRDDNSIDFEGVRQKTGHKKASTIMAYYLPAASRK
jgi:hypothetical protein